MSTDPTAPDLADDPDVALPTEDDDPESLAGGPVTFDPDGDDDSSDPAGPGSAEGQQPAGS